MPDRSKQRRQGPSAAAPEAAAAATPAKLLEEAETLQQRAERRSGQDALGAFEAAVGKYKEAIQAGLNEADHAEAAFGLGECLQLWADLELQLLQQTPDEQLAMGQEQQVQARAAALYQASLEVYQQVADGSLAGASQGSLRPDAAVNAANALTSWAGLVDSQQCRALLQQAVDLYQLALQQEEDALTLSNLGDTLVAQGEAALAAGDLAAGQDAFELALQRYQASCALSDSSAGDDLPGLLHNWGVGLHTISKQAQNPQLKQSLLQQAAEKLRSSTQFSRGDPAPHNALGDVLMDAAELLVMQQQQQQTTTTAVISSSAAVSKASIAGGMSASVPDTNVSAGVGGSTVLPAAVVAEAASLINQAVNDGYMAALTINRTNADALVGLAEASVAIAKLAKGQGDEHTATTHINTALGHYRSALQRPRLLGSASDRADIRYNAACTAALAGDFAMAQQLLTVLTATSTLQAQDVIQDEDLSPLRGQGWFADLVAQLQLQQQL